MHNIPEVLQPRKAHTTTSVVVCLFVCLFTLFLSQNMIAGPTRKQPTWSLAARVTHKCTCCNLLCYDADVGSVTSRDIT